jgi:hypothetical protein
VPHRKPSLSHSRQQQPLAAADPGGPVLPTSHSNRQCHGPGASGPGSAAGGAPPAWLGSDRQPGQGRLPRSASTAQASPAADSPSAPGSLGKAGTATAATGAAALSDRGPLWTAARSAVPRAAHFPDCGQLRTRVLVQLFVACWPSVGALHSAALDARGVRREGVAHRDACARTAFCCGFPTTPTAPTH